MSSRLLEPHPLGVRPLANALLDGATNSVRAAGLGALARLPGAGVSLFWALAAVLTFVLGHVLSTRSFRMLGLVGLVIAAARVLTHDITDLLGRIVACGALALAFFGVAWLYGRIISEKKAD